MPEDLPGKDLTLQPAGEHGLSLRRRPASKWKLKVASAVTAAAAIFGIGMKAEVPQRVAGAVGNTVNSVRQIPEAIQNETEKPLTEEQKRAIELLEGAGEGDLIHDLVVKGEEVKGANIVYLRNVPRTFIDLDDLARSGEGKLKEGDIVERAIAVWGNNRNSTIDSTRENVWYAFKDPDNPERVVFAFAELFEKNDKLSQVKPFDLETGERRDRRSVSETR